MNSPKPFVIDVNEQNFQQEVLDRSTQTTIIVDFWAPWCGPCRTLGPILEKLASEMNGGFILAKVNCDENQQLAAAFQVQGIPAVFAVKDQQVVSNFEGVLPEAQLRQFLTEVGVTKGTGGKTEEAKKPAPPANEADLRKAIEKDRDDFKSRVELAKLLLDRPNNEREAFEMLKPVEPGEFHSEAERLRAIIDFRETPHTDSDLTQAEVLADSQADNPAVVASLGLIHAARGDYNLALDILLSAAELDKQAAKEVVRPIMVKIFHILGVRSEISDEYRAKLQSLLY